MSKEDPFCAYLLIAIMFILLVATIGAGIWAASISSIVGIFEASIIVLVILYVTARYIIDNIIFKD